MIFEYLTKKILKNPPKKLSVQARKRAYRVEVWSKLNKARRTGTLIRNTRVWWIYGGLSNHGGFGQNPPNPPWFG